VIKAWVVVIGAGGGGAKSAFFPGPFGGAGGGIAKKLINLTGIKSVTVTVGTGGVGATDNGVGGTDGGTSSFGIYMYATGGRGGMINSSIPTAGRGVGGDENHCIQSIGHMLGPVNIPAYDEGAGKGGGIGFVSHDYSEPKTPGYGGNGYGGRPGKSPNGAGGQVTIQW
jgi:hypothetical protein